MKQVLHPLDQRNCFSTTQKQVSSNFTCNDDCRYPNGHASKPRLNRSADTWNILFNLNKCTAPVPSKVKYFKEFVTIETDVPYGAPYVNQILAMSRLKISNLLRPCSRSLNG